MSDVDLIRKALLERGVVTEADIVFDEGGGFRYFVSIPVARDRDNKQVPSNRRLTDAQTWLQEQGVIVVFLLRDGVTQDLETGLRATLLHSYIEHIRNVFLSIDGSIGHVWLEQKRDLNAQIIADIGKRASDFLQLSEFDLGSIASLTDAALPSQLACMAAIRQLAPARIEDIVKLLLAKGFTIPSEHRVNQRLDTLRRSGRIVRLGSGHYALSMQSLQALGTAKNSRSPDIDRMLALARRGNCVRPGT